MTEQLDWSTLGNTKVGDVERPPLLPQGHYVAMVAGQVKRDKTEKKGTLFAEVPFTVTEALDDVDPDELNNAGGLPEKAQKITFYLTEKSLWRFTEFGKGMGLSEDYNILEMCDALAECQEPFVVEHRHEASKDNPDRVFGRWDNPIPYSQYKQ